MDEQSKFKEALASVTIRAEENGGKLSAEEAKELLKDMEFNDEQMSMIYAYLASKGYVVEGAVLPEKEQETVHGGGRGVSGAVSERYEVDAADRQKRCCRNCFQLPWQENRKRSVC